MRVVSVRICAHLYLPCASLKGDDAGHYCYAYLIHLCGATEHRSDECVLCYLYTIFARGAFIVGGSVVIYDCIWISHLCTGWCVVHMLCMCPCTVEVRESSLSLRFDAKWS